VVGRPSKSELGWRPHGFLRPWSTLTSQYRAIATSGTFGVSRVRPSAVALALWRGVIFSCAVTGTLSPILPC